MKRSALIFWLLILSNGVGAASNSFITFSGNASDGKVLAKDNITVGFDKQGLKLITSSAITWKAKTADEFTIEEEGPNGYRIKFDNQDGLFEKATHVTVENGGLVISLDREALPIPSAAAHKAAKKAEKEASGKTFGTPLYVRMALAVVSVLLLFLGGVFALKKFGKRNKWLSSFLKSENFKSGPLLETISTHNLGPKRQVVVLRAGGEFLLVGCSGDRMTLLGKIDEQAVVEENDLLEKELEQKQVELP